MPKRNKHITEQNMKRKTKKEMVMQSIVLTIQKFFKSSIHTEKIVWKHIVTLTVSRLDSWHIVLFIDECGSGVYSGIKVVFIVRNQVQSGISM